LEGIVGTIKKDREQKERLDNAGLSTKQGEKNEECTRGWRREEKSRAQAVSGIL
jgi:hypothetical protein